MNRFATPSRLLLALAGTLVATAAVAQPVRTTDVRWARDVGGATLTLDGNLSEAEWAQADSVVLQYGQTFYAPGGGYDDFFGSNGGRIPADPSQGTVKFLRAGNVLYIGLRARDRSLNGGILRRGEFFNHDGLVMSISNRAKRINREAQTPRPINSTNGQYTDEIFFAWLNDDTTAVGIPAPNQQPTFYGNFVDAAGDGGLNGPFVGAVTGAAVVNGTSNNDTDTDIGYTMEVQIDLARLGYDLNGAGGDRVPLGFGLYDRDFSYPVQAEGRELTRSWWQNPWGGDQPHGVGFVYGQAGVTVSSGATPTVTEPELRLGTTSAALAIDGRLNEAVWSINPQVQLQYQPSLALLDAQPGYGPYYTHWFRPGGDAPDAPPVVDATTGRIRMFYQGNRLVVGLDTDDQAVSGAANEDRGDGLRLVVRQRSSEESTPGGAYIFRGYLAFIDSSGALRVRRESPDTTGQSTVPELQRGLYVKPGTTVSDPADVDAGYQIELSLDLTSVPGYESGIGDRQIWIGAAYFDGDQLPDDTQSYGTRAWWLVERGGGIFGGPAAQTYLDPAFVLAGEDEVDAGDGFRVVGSVPNPTRGQTAVRYVLPGTADVTVEVFDVLGRRVATVEAGRQAAGEHAVTVDASALAPGAYAVRVRTADGATAAGRMTVLR